MTYTTTNNADLHVKHHPNYGTSLYASRSFAAATVVVCEEALLLSKPAPHSNADQLVQKLQAACLAATQATAQPLKPSVARWRDACEKVVAFLAAPAHTQQVVLQEMDATLDSSSPLSAMCQLFAQVIAQELPALLESPGVSAAPSPPSTCPSDDSESARESKLEVHSSLMLPACGPAWNTTEEFSGLSPQMQQGDSPQDKAFSLCPAGSSTGPGPDSESQQQHSSSTAGPDSESQQQHSSSTAGLAASMQHSSITGPPGSQQQHSSTASLESGPQHSSSAGLKPSASGPAGHTVTTPNVMSQDTIHAVLRAFEVNAHSTKLG